MKPVCLGSAMFGWKIGRSQAFEILDAYYESGGRSIDTANNYPLNGDYADYRRSPLLIGEWLRRNSPRDCQITFKAGSLSNVLSPNNDLTPDFLSEQYDWAQEQFGDSFSGLMLHWDNRNDPEQIRQTLFACERFARSNIRLGFSGIAYPELYAELLKPELFSSVDIQVKQNFAYSGLEHYRSLCEFKPRYWAYGISASGLKLKASQYGVDSYATLTARQKEHAEFRKTPKFEALVRTIQENACISSTYQAAIAYAEADRRLYGYLLGPSTAEQMRDIARFRDRLSTADTTIYYEESL